MTQRSTPGHRGPRSLRPAHCVGPESVCRATRGIGAVGERSRWAPSAPPKLLPSGSVSRRSDALYSPGSSGPPQPTCWSPAIHQRAGPNVQPNAGRPDIGSCHPTGRTLAVRRGGALAEPAAGGTPSGAHGSGRAGRQRVSVGPTASSRAADRGSGAAPEGGRSFDRTVYRQPAGEPVGARHKTARGEISSSDRRLPLHRATGSRRRSRRRSPVTAAPASWAVEPVTTGLFLCF